MKDFLKRYRIAIAITLVASAGAVAVIFVFVLDLIDVFNPMTTADGMIAGVQAAWFQAIFSVIAILAAVVVGIFQSRQNRQLVESERHRKEKIDADDLHRQKIIFAAITMRTLYGINKESERRLEEIKGHMTTFNGASGPVRVDPFVAILKKFHLSTVDSAPTSEDIAHRFDLTSGIALAGALDSGAGFNRTLKNLITTAQDEPYHSSEDVTDVLHQIHGKLEFLKTKTSDVMDVLGSAYGVTGRE